MPARRPCASGRKFTTTPATWWRHEKFPADLAASLRRFRFGTRPGSRQTFRRPAARPASIPATFRRRCIPHCIPPVRRRGAPCLEMPPALARLKAIAILPHHAAKVPSRSTASRSARFPLPPCVEPSAWPFAPCGRTASGVVYRLGPIPACFWIRS